MFELWSVFSHNSHGRSSAIIHSLLSFYDDLIEIYSLRLRLPRTYSTSIHKLLSLILRLSLFMQNDGFSFVPFRFTDCHIDSSLCLNDSRSFKSSLRRCIRRKKNRILKPLNVSILLAFHHHSAHSAHSIIAAAHNGLCGTMQTRHNYVTGSASPWCIHCAYVIRNCTVRNECMMKWWLIVRVKIMVLYAVN